MVVRRQWIIVAFAFLAAAMTGCSTWQVQHSKTTLAQRAGAQPAFKPLSANAKTQSAMNTLAVHSRK